MIRFIILFLICSVANGQLVIDQYKFAPPAPANLYIYANASNPTETNAVTGWENQAGTTIASVATTTPVGGGSYVIEITSIDGSGSDRGITNLTVEVGETYYYEYWGRQTVGSQGFVRSWVGCTGASSHGFTGTWTKYTGTFTATDTTAYPRMYAVDSPGSAGDKIQIDLFYYYKTS